MKLLKLRSVFILSLRREVQWLYCLGIGLRTVYTWFKLLSGSGHCFSIYTGHFNAEGWGVSLYSE